MRKLRSRRGETLVETLVSLLIVVLVMAFLATSIVAATRVNAKMRDADVAVRYLTDFYNAENAAGGPQL